MKIKIAAVFLFLLSIFPAMAKENTVILDFSPIVVSHVEKNKIVYTLDLAVRLVVSKESADRVQKDAVRIRHNMLMAVSRYIEKKPDYKEVSYREIKEYLKSYLKSHHPDGGIEDVLILTAFIR